MGGEASMGWRTILLSIGLVALDWVADMGWNLATERTDFARYIPHYTQFVASPVHNYQIQRAVYVLLCRLLPATIPFLVGPSEETTW